MQYIYLFLFRASMYPSSGENYCIYATLLLSLCMGGDWSTVWSETPTSRPDATHAEWQEPVSRRYSNFLLMMGTWMPDKIN